MALGNRVRLPDVDPDSTREDAFQRQVTLALEHCSDAFWLGTKSPLSAPYLLGTRLDALHLDARAPTATERGATLFGAMQEAAAAIDDPELRTVIENRYLNRNQYLSNTGLALRSGVSERTFYRQRNRAIEQFSTKLYALLIPPLRLERPDTPLLSGRRFVATSLRNFLAEGRSVYLSGESGIGKSTLAASVTRSFAGTRDLFWFTVRPGFNDHYTSFVFALAYFLHEHGAPNTWRQIIAESGRLHDERTLALLRHDCTSLSKPVIICVDEVDQLRVEVADHGQLFGLLETLQLFAPQQITLLLVGQRIVLRTQVQVPLTGFSEEEVRDWLRDNGLGSLSHEQVIRLHTATRGSPLMLTLFAALASAGEDLDSLLIRFGDDPPLESLLMRIWQRLSARERTLLMRLAVFEVAAPADAWRDEEEAIITLAERGLVNKTSADLLVVSPHLRPLVYSLIPVENRREYHGYASRLLEERGNITGAMRQAVTARDETRALMLWLLHSEEQIARGQTNTALEILRSIATTDLATPALGPVLQMARSSLELLLGNVEDASHLLRNIPTFSDSAAEGYRKYLYGRSLEHLGDYSQSDAILQDALDLLAPPILFMRTRIFNLQGYLRILRMRDLSQGRRVAAGARIEAEVLQGWVEEAGGNLLAARTYFESALARAEESGAEPRVLAYVCGNLGRVVMNLNEIDAGIGYMQRAIEQYDVLGDLANSISNRVNIAYAQTISGKPEKGLETALIGLESALRMKDPYLIAGLSAAAGEAAVATGDWEDAERYLNLSLQHEEEFFRPWALTALGVLRARQDRHVEAVRLLESAASEAQNIEDTHGVAYALYPLALSYQALGDLEAARANAARAHEIYCSLGMANEIKETAALLHDLEHG